MSDQEKRYSEREVARIIQAAVDLEKNELHPDGRSLSLADLEDIAKETGISVEHLRRAASEIAEFRKASPAGALLGAETSFEATEFVSETLTQPNLDQLNKSLPALVSSSDSTVAGNGTIRVKRGILKSLMDGFPLDLNIKQIQTGTEIQIRANLKSVAALVFAVFGGIGVALGLKIALISILMFGIGTLGLPLNALILGLGALLGLGGSWLTARAVFRAFVKRSRRKVSEIARSIKSKIQALR